MGSFQRAVRHRAKARIGLSGPSGSGKTYSALLLARGLGSRIAMIDTENHSGELYSDIANYDISVLEKPFNPDKYVALLKEAEAEKYDVIIIDSLSHAWAGEGGVLDIVDKKMDYEKNKFAAWRTVTPKHNNLVETMLQSKCHIIATMRSKQEYEQYEEGGKRKIRRVGMAPIMRDGIEYEFTLFGELSVPSHLIEFTKDRTSMFLDQSPVRVTPALGEKILNWLNIGTANYPVNIADSPREEEALPVPIIPLHLPDITPVVSTGAHAKEPEKDGPFWDAGKAAQLRTALEKLSTRIGKPVTLDDTRLFIKEMFGLDSHKKLKKHQFQMVQDWINRSWAKKDLDSYLPKVD